MTDAVVTPPDLKPEDITKATAEGLIGEDGGIKIEDGMQPHEFYLALQANMQGQDFVVLNFESRLLSVVAKIKNRANQKECDLPFEMKQQQDDQEGQIVQLVRQALDELA